MSKYYIWSNEHKAWWRPNSRGYTNHVSAAGEYSLKEALTICSSGRSMNFKATGVPPELPVLISTIEILINMSESKCRNNVPEQQ